MKKPKIAVLLPVGYRGGTLRAALQVANALYHGSRAAKNPADIVFGHPDDPKLYSDQDFDILHPDILRRPFFWRVLSHQESVHALSYAGITPDAPLDGSFMVPDDRINNFLDCDAWVFISDRIAVPILPIRPYFCCIYDYLQRYEPIMGSGDDIMYLRTARQAAGVIVTSKATLNDAVCYAGLKPEKVYLQSHLIPDFASYTQSQNTQDSDKKDPYFIWTTNAAIHKNHVNMLLALKHYYEVSGGTLRCVVTGVNTKNMLDDQRDHLAKTKEIFQSSAVLQDKMSWQGDLDDRSYAKLLEQARFLVHAGRNDNGTYAVIEAAIVNVPSLSSRYPAMEEMEETYRMGLKWMDPFNPIDMAENLKFMEENYLSRRKLLPAAGFFDQFSAEKLGLGYWEAVRRCL